MKHLVTAVGITLLLVASVPALTDELPDHPELEDGILLRPVDMIVGFALGVANVSVEYQHAFSESVGMSVSPSFAYYSFGGVTAYGGGVEVGPRFLLSATALSRWYVYPFVSFAYASGSEDDTDVDASGGAWALGAEVGFAWTYPSGFMMNLGGGLAYFGYTGDLSDVDQPLPIIPRINFSLGYGWK